MSFSRARQILSGLKNTFTDIPLDALTAEGTPSSGKVLYGSDNGRGLWKDLVLVDPPSPEFDNSAISAGTGVLVSGSSFFWPSGGGTGGAYGIVLLNNTSGAMDLTADVEVTWGGVPMTRKGGVYNNNISTGGWSLVFVLDGIPDGDQEIEVRPTQAGKTFAGYGSSYSYANIESVGGLLTAYGTGSPTLAITAENTNDIVWGAVCTGGVSMTGFSLTPRKNSPSGVFFSAGDATGGATVSATASATGWSAVGLDLIAAVAASPLGSVEPVAVQTANYTATAGQLVPVNAASGAITITLPTAPANGKNVVIKKMDSSTNPVTYQRGGTTDTINGTATSGTLILQYQAVRLQYDAILATWYIISTDAPLGQLDSRYLNQIAPGTHAASSKSTPVDADELPIADSAASFVLKKLTFANLKAFIKSYLDGVYEPLEQFAILPVPYTFPTSTTAAQQLLNTTTNGAITLPVGQYFFECAFSLTGMSSTSGSFGFGLGGGATFTQAWTALVEKSGAGLVGGTPILSWATAPQTTMIPANANTTGAMTIKGIVKVTAAGTVIPQVSLTQAAAATVGALSYFRIQSVNSAAADAGAWS